MTVFAVPSAAASLGGNANSKEAIVERVKDKITPETSRTQVKKILAEEGVEISRREAAKVKKEALENERFSNPETSPQTVQPVEPTKQSDSFDIAKMDQQLEKDAVAKDISDQKNSHIDEWNNAIQGLAAEFGTTPLGLQNKIRGMEKRQSDPDSIKRFDEMVQMAQSNYPIPVKPRYGTGRGIKRGHANRYSIPVATKRL